MNELLLQDRDIVLVLKNHLIDYFKLNATPAVSAHTMEHDGIINNRTIQREFYIQPFSVDPQVHLVLFIGILIIYLAAMLANLIISTLIIRFPQFHTPMYFFLCNLSLLDMIFVSVTLPKLLSIILTKTGTIVFTDCITQMYFFISTANIESFLLTSMAYDRYVAICNPLRYTAIMTNTSNILLVFVSWLLGLLNSLLLTLLTSGLSFCKLNIIKNFFCDLKALLKLSCSDVTIIQIIILIDNVIIGFIPSLLTVTSYAYIISSVLKINSTEGRRKAFSNCTSHLTTVLIYYGTGLCLYMIPDSENSQNDDTILSLLYIALVPMVNPLVYSLRNKEVLSTLAKCGT
ncbi:olfactory receptor 1G1-like [Rhinophrynus dorsalis]